MVAGELRRFERAMRVRDHGRHAHGDLGVVCGDVPAPVDFDGARQTDSRAYAAFFHAMLAEGVALAPGAYEAVFIGLGHDDAVIEDIGEAASRAARAAVTTTATLS